MTPWHAAPALALVAVMTLQRLLELGLAARNTRLLRARGAVEAGSSHYPSIVALHAAFLASLLLEGWRSAPPAWWPLPLGVFLLAQALRYWAVAALGPRWTTRVLVLPGAEPVRHGPYRWLRHPNYLAVVAEMAAAPCVVGAYWASAWAVANVALLLAVRIPAEERALAAAPGIIGPGRSRAAWPRAARAGRISRS